MHYARARLLGLRVHVRIRMADRREDVRQRRHHVAALSVCVSAMEVLSAEKRLDLLSRFGAAEFDGHVPSSFKMTTFTGK